jgi:glycosyltransferase involved in cell wall biosynthesis
MKKFLDIITVTKDDPSGVAATIASTRKLRACAGVRQIVVDSSSEPVAAKIRELLAGEENLDYVWQAPGGIASAFNLGISHSSADWLWFLNGGDAVHPDLVESLLLQILDLTQAGIVIFELEYMQVRSRSKHPPLWALWPPMYGHWVPHPATIIRAKLFGQYGVFDTSYKIAMDAEWWMRVFSQNVVVDMLSIPIVLYDQYGVSSTNLIDTGKEAERIFSTNFRRLVRIWLDRGVHLFRAFFLKR